ncbi:MAG: quinone-dependent dihydroorotate dehydrogenase [Cyclobacteriaceae bacterium]|nr:quinone-dependent dihydroorotate dehydrogenase [Cyclobacteriaceae bacterium]
MYKLFIRPILFMFGPEQAHRITTSLLKMVIKISGGIFLFNLLFKYKNKKLEREVFGIKFENPVGLAAGFDKEAEFIDEFASLGFGFIEIGTITPLGQPGNPKPRLFRLKADEALINRMGFNNQGVEHAVEMLKKRKSSVIVGGNIGKNKITPNEEAARDYELCFEALFEHVDYFAVNVSSPNTPDLRELQDKEPLKQLLMRLKERNDNKKHPKPILLKIAPDLSDEQLDDIIEIVEEVNLAGVIATNTTISRDGLTTSLPIVDEIGNGGLSGKPVKDRSTQVIRYLKENAKIPFAIIGVGGINSPEDALEKIKAGASLIQLYTGFIYQGPMLIKRINKLLLKNSN